MQEKKYTLSYAILKDGKELKELIVNRPKIKDIRGLDLNNLTTDGSVTLLKNLIKPKLAEQEIDTIDLKDFKELQEIVTSFLQK